MSNSLGTFPLARLGLIVYTGSVAREVVGGVNVVKQDHFNTVSLNAVSRVSVGSAVRSAGEL